MLIGRPVTPQTPFFTGSTGKSFTALGIMQLVEVGQIKLDASVQTYLPWFRVADVNASEVITVRQLLNQVSGIPQSIGQKQLANTDLSDSAIETNVQELATIELIAPPGERYEYSNSNYVVLGMIIQAVTGQSYEMYIREHNMQMVYAGVMLIPVLYLIAVLATIRRIRHWRTSPQLSAQIQVARFIAFPLIWNAVVAYIHLVFLPVAFGANLGAVILFQPDVGWIAVISGIFAIVWGVISTGIGISMLHQTVKETEIV